MIVEQYGVRYLRIQEKDLELIRYWRNQPYIRSTMQFREYITPEMQKNWFDRINNKYNYYFIIEHEGKQIGLINCKDTEPETRIAEGGIFIWEQIYWGSPVPVFAALTMLEAVFEIFKSGDCSVATILKENTRALNFNKILGYEITGENEAGDCYKLTLTKEKYLSHLPKIKKAAAIFSKGQSEMKIFAEAGPLLADEINEFLVRGTRGEGK
ncbi:MAG: GNAT family N-acetyltransferase [Bacteroidia bacterium]|nr:GNAT family N-acetyltransferase [Bacteroidia bacterium]